MERRNKILFGIFFIIFLGAVIFGIYYWTSQKERESVYEEMQNQNQESVTEEEPVEVQAEEPEEEPEIEETVEIPIQFDELKKQNPEIYAWIRIPDTAVDYPVLRRPEDDSYYLDHTVEGAEGLPGSIYTESLNADDFSDRNTVIYGHNMKDGSMFGSLKEYKDSAYMEEHSVVYIYTPEHIYTYQVFAAVTYDSRHILRAFDFSSEEGMQSYLDSLTQTRNMSSYVKEDVPVSSSDRIITLSTCNGNDNQRYLIGAVLTDEK